jgi:hypothetical protein
MSKLTMLTGCAADCDSEILLTAIPATQDCTSYSKKLAQISDLYIMPTGATNPLTSWATTPTATAGAIDNTEELNAKCKWLVGKGRVTSTETIELYPKGKKKVTETKYLLEFDVFDIENHYNFLRLLQCGGTGLTFWYGDLADYIYGLTGGIPPERFSAKNASSFGDEDKQMWTISAEWTADGDPERRVNPL